MQLRYLQTLNGIAMEQNSTIVFPLPVDLLSIFQKYQFGVNVAPVKSSTTKPDKTSTVMNEILITPPSPTTTEI